MALYWSITFLCSQKRLPFITPGIFFLAQFSDNTTSSWKRRHRYFLQRAHNAKTLCLVYDDTCGKWDPVKKISAAYHSSTPSSLRTKEAKPAIVYRSALLSENQVRFFRNRLYHSQGNSRKTSVNWRKSFSFQVFATSVNSAPIHLLYALNQITTLWNHPHLPANHPRENSQAEESIAEHEWPHFISSEIENVTFQSRMKSFSLNQHARTVHCRQRYNPWTSGKIRAVLSRE